MPSWVGQGSLGRERERERENKCTDDRLLVESTCTAISISEMSFAEFLPVYFVSHVNRGENREKKRRLFKNEIM